MKILVTGATGFIGSKLVPRLFKDGHDIVILARDREKAARYFNLPCAVYSCDLAAEVPAASVFNEVQAVIHLAGESISAKRWSAGRRLKIRQSRVQGTRNLVKGMKRVGVAAPSIFISMSAIGVYGDRANEQLVETSKTGTGFLSELCQDWEAQAFAAQSAQTRVICLRLGIVLGAYGGALSEVVKIFSLGLGAVLGSGRQWMSWVHLNDVVESICFVLNYPKLKGVINVVAPEPVTNQAFSEILANALGKNILLRVPERLARIVFGKKAEVMLSSSLVFPAELDSLGFKFRYPKLPQALEHILHSRK